MAFENFWRIISTVGDFQVWLLIVSIILLFYLISPKSKKHRIAFLVFILIPSFVISSAIVEILKITLQMPRPCVDSIYCPSSYSFPSGHATTIFVLATVMILNTKNLGIKSAFLILAVLVSISRLALNYHTYADIIAGAFIGISTAYLTNLLYKRKILSLKGFKRIIS